jgi:hypothetical protein
MRSKHARVALAIALVAAAGGILSGCGCDQPLLVLPLTAAQYNEAVAMGNGQFLPIEECERLCVLPRDPTVDGGMRRSIDVRACQLGNAYDDAGTSRPVVVCNAVYLMCSPG